MKTVTLRNYKQNDSENSLRDIYAIVDASTNELNPLVCITFILTAYHARNDTEDG